MDIQKYLNLNPNIKIINQSSSSLLEHEKPAEELETIKNRGNFLLRQELEDKTPINTPHCIIIYHMIFIIIFLTFALIILITNSNKNFFEIKYTDCSKENKCIKSFNITKTMKQPIYLYYKLNNFYSNHIDFVKSKSYNQLRGQIVSEKKIDSSCKYMSRNREHFKTENTSEILSYKMINMEPNALMNPCGLIANSMFNDIFKLYDDKNNSIDIFDYNITLNVDKKFFRNDVGSEKTQWYNKEDDHFIVWMNMELFPNFIKKWGYIKQDLPKGQYTMIIENNWGKTQWEIEKFFVLAKGNVFGTSKFFGYILIFCCSFEILFILFICLSKYRKKKFNPEEMKWD